MLTTQAQDIWSLEKCVSYAMQNSLNIKQSQVSVAQAELGEDASKYARLPNLNASSNYGYQFGRTIDPVTNSFVDLNVGSNTWSLNSNVVVFNGGRINNTIKQSEFDTQAARSDMQQMQNDIALNVANAYLNVLFSEERLTNAKRQLALSEAQLEQTNRLIQAGSIPENDKYDILANIAQNDQAIVVQQNNVELAFLNLKQLLQLDPNTDLKIERPEINIPENTETDVLALNTVYATALNSQPFVRADEMRLRSAETGVDIASANFYPQLSLFGSVDTRFSTEGRRLVSTNPITFDDSPYFNQLEDNLGQSVGLSLRIPIYNNHTTKINVQRAELGITNAQITAERNKQNLKVDIQNSIANAKAAKKQLDAAQRTRDALRIAYENAEKRLNLGAVNTFQLTTAKNNLDNSEVDYIIAKYDYLFKLKIVDFYQGKPITL